LAGTIVGGRAEHCPVGQWQQRIGGSQYGEGRAWMVGKAKVELTIAQDRIAGQDRGVTPAWMT